VNLNGWTGGKQAVVIWNLEKMLLSCLKTEENQEILGTNGGSQDLLDAFSLN
jgi:hypothetical protein